MSCNNINNIITIDDDDNEIFYSVEKLTCNNDDIILLSETENELFSRAEHNKLFGKGYIMYEAAPRTGAGKVLNTKVLLFNSGFDDILIGQRSR